ncbi:MAG: hypothetical protein SGJ10_08010 [Bacteroidota bacterium]|nr:hypothetical protein [Bacteroidota bacterium]
MEKLCEECGNAIKGRADKKFCDDACRNIFNNKKNSDTSTYVKKVNNILRKNRLTLAKLNPEGKISVSKKQLTDLGFNFDYYTSTYTTKEGKKYFFCYEYGYLPNENEQWFLLVMKKGE